MAWPSNLQIALKEWAVVCAALESGRQIILLRKGGIYEAAGQFEIENRQFILFPTYLHQNAAMLKPEAQAHLKPTAAEPGEVRISAAGVITDIVEMPGRAVIDGLDPEHIWTRPLIEMRFNYRPENPLFLLLIRAYRLHRPLTIANTPAYAGCKSWVPLDQPIETGDALSVLDDLKYEFRRKLILEQMAAKSQ